MNTSGATQFTPGPWNAYNVHKGRILKHWQVDTGTGKVMLDDAAQWEAGNATIIAAAPAMYEALQSGLEIIEYFVREQRKAGIEEDDCIGIGDLRNFKTVLSQAEGR